MGALLLPLTPVLVLVGAGGLTPFKVWIHNRVPLIAIGTFLLQLARRKCHAAGVLARNGLSSY